MSVGVRADAPRAGNKNHHRLCPPAQHAGSALAQPLQRCVPAADDDEWCVAWIDLLIAALLMKRLERSAMDGARWRPYGDERSRVNEFRGVAGKKEKSKHVKQMTDCPKWAYVHGLPVKVRADIVVHSATVKKNMVL